MYLGIDIGGSKTLVASFDEEATLTESVRLETSNDYHTFLAALTTAIKGLGSHKFAACGIGMPGIIDRDRGICLMGGGNLPWKNCPIGGDIARVVNCPVRVENDANIAGLGEANLIKDQYATAVYITISTGIGGVLVIDGKIDPHTINAEVGHMIYRQPDGNYLSWEKLASGKTIVEKYGQRADEISDPAIWKAVTEPIAMGIINVSAALTPQVIILGGGAGAHLDTFKPYLDEWLQKLTPGPVTVPPVLQAQRPEEAVIYGCYDLAKQTESHAAADN